MNTPEKRSMLIPVVGLVFGLTFVLQSAPASAEQKYGTYCSSTEDPVGVATKVGCDIGIGLTVIDKAHDGESFRFDSSTFLYSSISNLKTDHFRLIAQLAALDMFEDIDFETGLGLGLLWRPNGEQSPNALGIAAGAGYNLMADQSKEGWYAFVGFSWNFNRQVAADQD